VPWSPFLCRAFGCRVVDCSGDSPRSDGEGEGSRRGVFVSIQFRISLSPPVSLSRRKKRCPNASVGVGLERAWRHVLFVPDQKTGRPDITERALLTMFKHVVDKEQHTDRDIAAGDHYQKGQGRGAGDWKISLAHRAREGKRGHSILSSGHKEKGREKVWLFQAIRYS